MTTYQAPPAAAPCVAQAPTTGTLQPTPAPSTYATQQQPAPAVADQKPTLQAPQAPQTTSAQRPADTSTPNTNVQPEPGTDNKSPSPYDVKKSDSSTYFEAPQLFQKDRTAQRGSIAPVRTALYQQPVTYRQTSATTNGPVTAAKAQQDAAGWASASH